ncbi:MAG: isopentenyl phosphate kinase family protein [Ignisphaera sp.]|nr:isopentenyl phosphate kinase family protein [Ignisphaera sp.]
MSSEVNVIKLGGSIITDKSKYYRLRYNEIIRIAKEISIAYSNCGSRMIIVHGGGSFGHPTVAEYQGVPDADAFSQVVYYMKELNSIIIDALKLFGVPAFSVDTHAVFYRDCNGMLQLFSKPLEEAIKKGAVPVLYGDAILSCNDFEVLSGDEIVWRLSHVFKPCRLLFAVDVDGVYDKHPSVPGARLLPVVSIRDVHHIDFGAQSRRVDVTGEMRSKLMLGARYWNSNIEEVIIFNGLKRDFIRASLCKEAVPGTRVTP